MLGFGSWFAFYGKAVSVIAVLRQIGFCCGVEFSYSRTNRRPWFLFDIFRRFNTFFCMSDFNSCRSNSKQLYQLSFLCTNGHQK